MADDTIITCEDCGNEFEKWTSSGGIGQLFCPKCGSDCTEEDNSKEQPMEKKQFTDDELKDHVYELKQIIRKLLFQPIEHTDHFRNKVSEEEKRKVVNEYIYEKIYNQIV